jgi:hypothetical protein
MTRDAPLWHVCAGLGVFFVVTYVMVRGLEKQGVFVRM